MDRSRQFQALLLLLFLFQFQFRGSLASRRHRHSHHSHRHHNLLSNSKEELRQELVPAEGSEEEPVFVAAYRSRKENESQESDENDDGNSMMNSVENRVPAALESYSSFLCIEDEEDIDRRIRHLGVKCRCPKTQAPVCGSDDVTYFNRCFLHCRAQQAAHTYHRYKITLRKFGPCDD